MIEKVSLLIKNRSGKFLLVKPKAVEGNKKVLEAVTYALPELAVGDEETSDQTLLILLSRICEGVDVEECRPVLEFESDDSTTIYYHWQGDVEISKSFYEFYESYIFLTPNEFGDDVNSELDLIFNEIIDLDL